MQSTKLAQKSSSESADGISRAGENGTIRRAASDFYNIARTLVLFPIERS